MPNFVLFRYSARFSLSSRVLDYCSFPLLHKFHSVLRDFALTNAHHEGSGWVVWLVGAWSNLSSHSPAAQFLFSLQLETTLRYSRAREENCTSARSAEINMNFFSGLECVCAKKNLPTFLVRVPRRVSRLSLKPWREVSIPSIHVSHIDSRDTHHWARLIHHTRHISQFLIPIPVCSNYAPSSLLIPKRQR